MLKLLGIAVIAGALFMAASGKGPDLGSGTDGVRAGVTSLFHNPVKGQGDEQDGDRENADEPDSGSDP